MRRIGLPSSFEQFSEIGGELEFAAFEDAAASDAVEAIGRLLDDIAVRIGPGHGEAFDPDKLTLLGGRPIDEQTFFGPFLDFASGGLLEFGMLHTRSRVDFLDRSRSDPSGIRLAHPELAEPVVGEGGNFAKAFLKPVHGLGGKPKAIQRLFDEIRGFLLPVGVESHIVDWSNAELPSVHSFFEAGMEWWGVYLFTIHTPAVSRIVVIAASATD